MHIVTYACGHVVRVFCLGSKASERRTRDGVLAWSEWFQHVDILGKLKAAGWMILKRIQNRHTLTNDFSLVMAVWRSQQLQRFTLSFVRCSFSKDSQLPLCDNVVDIDSRSEELIRVSRIIGDLISLSLKDTALESLQGNIPEMLS